MKLSKSTCGRRRLAALKGLDFLTSMLPDFQVKIALKMEPVRNWQQWLDADLP
jgi:hypothetical protein